MNLLIDTHVLIWLGLARSKVSKRALDALSDPDNEVLVSVASAYEIEFKRQRSPDLRGLPADLNALVEGQGLRWAEVDLADMQVAGRLPRHHGDPWDRILIAQAQNRSAMLVSADRVFGDYATPILW